MVHNSTALLQKACPGACMVLTSMRALFEYGEIKALDVSRLMDIAKGDLYSLSTRWINEVLIHPLNSPGLMKGFTLIYSINKALRFIHNFLPCLTKHSVASKLLITTQVGRTRHLDLHQISPHATRPQTAHRSKYQYQHYKQRKSQANQRTKEKVQKEE